MKLDPSQKGASVVWRKDHFLGIASRYRDLLELLLDNLECVPYVIKLISWICLESFYFMDIALVQYSYIITKAL